MQVYYCEGNNAKRFFLSYYLPHFGPNLKSKLLGLVSFFFRSGSGTIGDYHKHGWDRMPSEQTRPPSKGVVNFGRIIQKRGIKVALIITFWWLSWLVKGPNFRPKLFGGGRPWKLCGYSTVKCTVSNIDIVIR